MSGRCPSTVLPQGFWHTQTHTHIHARACARTHAQHTHTDGAAWPLPRDVGVAWGEPCARDPYLGYVLVQPVVKGIQSQGVIANVKHFIDNNQEGLIGDAPLPNLLV